MLVLSNSTVQTLLPGQSITFDAVVSKSGCGEFHRSRSANTRLCAKCGRYDIEFYANVTNATAAAEVSLGISLDGDVLPETHMASTPSAAGAYNNVSAGTLVHNCCGKGTVTVRNDGPNTITVAPGSCLKIKRVA